MVVDLGSKNRPVGMDPKSLGREAFLLRPGDFSVIDGDTIWALSNSGQGGAQSGFDKPQKAFAMRFRSIAAPEKPKAHFLDAIMRENGIDPNPDSAGQKATDLLKTYLDKRALLVHPTGEMDKYGRMICDMSVVPYTGKNPDLGRALSLENLMLEQKVVSPFRNETPPALRSSMGTRSSVLDKIPGI